MQFDFEWDDDKAERNMRKHGVTFEEAQTVFRDPLAFVLPDLRHSRFEERELVIGWSDQARALTIAFTRRGLAIRIISARMATTHERRNLER